MTCEYPLKRIPLNREPRPSEIIIAVCGNFETRGRPLHTEFFEAVRRNSVKRTAMALYWQTTDFSPQDIASICGYETCRPARSAIMNTADRIRQNEDFARRYLLAVNHVARVCGLAPKDEPVTNERDPNDEP